jgi:hypothetical protein
VIALRGRACGVIVLAAAAIACGRSREGVIEFDGQPALSVTEDELANYVRWWRDYLTLVDRHRIELEAVTQRVSSKYPLAQTDRSAQDPELLATFERQRRAMQELMNHMPVDGLKMQALRDAVPGVATFDLKGGKAVYVPGHDEIVLAAARKRYGDKFIDWLISRESSIARALSG